MFSLQGLKHFREFGQLSLGSILGHGGLGGFALHHRGVSFKNQELLVMFGQSLFELGVLLHDVSELLPQALYPRLRTQDLPGITV